LEYTDRGDGFLRQVAQNFLPFRDDVLVPGQTIRDMGLREGIEIQGLAREAAVGGH